MKPENVLTYAHFMHDIGSLKNKPAGLSDLFFENLEMPAAIDQRPRAQGRC
jgi:NitT/TauT family transport system substrate-binding protein